MGKEERPKLSEKEFVVRAIKKLRKPPYKGIHTVFSGFNNAFRQYFGTNPVETTQRLAQEKKIAIRPVKGGVMLYLLEDAPEDSAEISVVEQQKLHEAFLSALGDNVISHSNVHTKPLEVDLKPPLPHKIRLYIYNATHPPGGRTLGEHKIQLIVPGQARGQRGSFDHGGERIVLLVGYQPELKVFILWEADLYPEFAYSRNIQVKAETVYAAIAGKIGQQERHIRGQGMETVLTAGSNNLVEAILLRMELTRYRLLKG